MRNKATQLQDTCDNFLWLYCDTEVGLAVVGHIVLAIALISILLKTRKR